MLSWHYLQYSCAIVYRFQPLRKCYVDHHICPTCVCTVLNYSKHCLPSGDNLLAPIAAQSFIYGPALSNQRWAMTFCPIYRTPLAPKSVALPSAVMKPICLSKEAIGVKICAPEQKLSYGVARPGFNGLWPASLLLRAVLHWANWTLIVLAKKPTCEAAKDLRYRCVSLVLNNLCTI